MYKFIFALAVSLHTSSCLADNSVLEDYNQWMYEINDRVDETVVEPVARYYDVYIPHPVQIGVHNVFENLKSPMYAVNNLLQGKWQEAGEESVRFIANTTFGFGGLFDVATPGGLASNKEDFGQTLAVWGMEAGPYVVLPLLGPSTLRDAFSQIVDGQMNLMTASQYDYQTTTQVIYLIDTRADLLTATDLLDSMKGDAYLFTKESYLQKREYDIFDGNPPMTQEEMDFDLSPIDSDLKL